MRGKWRRGKRKGRRGWGGRDRGREGIERRGRMDKWLKREERKEVTVKVGNYEMSRMIDELSLC